MKSESEAATTSASPERAHWMSVLARARRTSLERVLRAAGDLPAYAMLRAPEVGLVMLRGRAGGTGAPFNMGEASVARCALRLEDGIVGHAYVMGTDLRHAELAALADALLQQDGGRSAQLIAPLEAEIAEGRAEAARRSAATRVEFFTMVRGDA